MRASQHSSSAKLKSVLKDMEHQSGSVADGGTGGVFGHAAADRPWEYGCGPAASSLRAMRLPCIRSPIGPVLHRPHDALESAECGLIALETHAAGFRTALRLFFSSCLPPSPDAARTVLEYVRPEQTGSGGFGSAVSSAGASSASVPPAALLPAAFRSMEEAATLSTAIVDEDDAIIQGAGLVSSDATAFKLGCRTALPLAGIRHGFARLIASGIADVRTRAFGDRGNSNASNRLGLNQEQEGSTFLQVWPASYVHAAVSLGPRGAV